MIVPRKEPSVFKTFIHKATLDYCDGPLIIQLTDNIGGNYLGIVRDQDDAFVVIGTPPDLIHKFRCGMVDLKAVVLGSQLDPWYLGSFNDDQQTLQASPQFGRAIEQEISPEEGSFLHYHSDLNSDELSQLARDTETTLIQLSLDSLDLDRRNRLSTEVFRTLLLRVHALLESACPGTVNLDVLIPARQGSFQVLLDASSSYRNQLIERSEFVAGLKTVDSLFDVGNDYGQQRIENLFEENSDSHGLVKSYVDLLEFLNKRSFSFAFGWYENSGHSNRTSLSLRQTQNLVASVAKHVKQKVENVVSEVEITGILVSCSIPSGSWVLMTKKNTQISGRVSQNNKKLLEGLVIGKSYKFHCKQRASPNTILSNLSPAYSLVECENL